MTKIRKGRVVITATSNMQVERNFIATHSKLLPNLGPVRLRPDQHVRFRAAGEEIPPVMA